MMQPSVMSGAVEKPNSSAPSSAATAMSRPVRIWPSACKHVRGAHARQGLWRVHSSSGTLSGARASRRSQGAHGVRCAPSLIPHGPAARCGRAGRWPPASGGSPPGRAPTEDLGAQWEHGLMGRQRTQGLAAGSNKPPARGAIAGRVPRCACPSRPWCAPACLMDVHLAAPVPPSWPLMSTWSAWPLTTPLATTPTPFSLTSLTEMLAGGRSGAGNIRRRSRQPARCTAANRHLACCAPRRSKTAVAHVVHTPCSPPSPPAQALPQPPPAALTVRPGWRS